MTQILRLEPHDAFGNLRQVEEGTDAVVVEVEGPGGHAIEIQLTRTAQYYMASWISTMIGIHYVTVLMMDQVVGASPFHVEVHPASACATNSTITGEDNLYHKSS